MAADVASLDTYLGLNGSINTDRATLLLSLATDLCLSIVNPLPDGCDPVVLDVAARAYSNPTNGVTGAASAFGPSQPPPMGGLWLTKANIAFLRRLSPSGSGAFTIDPTPADAGPYSFWFQAPETWEDALANVSGPFSEWDQPPT